MKPPKVHKCDHHVRVFYCRAYRGVETACLVTKLLKYLYIRVSSTSKQKVQRFERLF